MTTLARIGLMCGGLLWLSGQQAARADVLRLSNGQELEGIIVKEIGPAITVQVSWQGYVTLDREAVMSIVRGDEPEHERLLSDWREQFLASQERERQRKALEARQRERGLVKHNGEWLTREELAVLQEQARREAQARQEREQREEEANRLRALEEEIRRLRQQVAERRYLVVTHDVFALPRRKPGLIQDEHGNLIHVGEHEGHRFFTMTDGTHVDLQPHDGHLAFTDEQGLHRDLTSVHH